MFFSQTAPRDGEYHQGDVAERDPDDGNNSFFGRARSAVEDSDYNGRLRRPKVGATHRSPGLDSEQSTDFKLSIVRRTVRAVGRFSIVVLIGVGATLALLMASILLGTSTHEIVTRAGDACRPIGLAPPK